MAQQRIGNRSGSIAGLDSSLTAKEGQFEARRAHHEQLKAGALKALSTSQDAVSESEDTTDEYTTEDETFIYGLPTTKKQQIISPRVNATLDRTNTSVRKASMIVASVLNKAGVPASTVTLSKSTIHRHRQQQRRKSSQQIRQSFCSKKSVVHWDGKLLVDTDESTQLVDRIAVLLTSSEDGSTKLLGVPKLGSGTGREIADAVAVLLVSWGAGIDTVGMCFDTTASNTGRFSGACVLLESLFQRPLLWMACRHHMFDVLLAEVFKECIGPSTGPDILLFKHFRSTWSKLHHQPQDARPLVEAPLDILRFLQTTMDSKQPREDYLELIHLAARAVGFPVAASLRRPGALHRARWMAKAIYLLKIELLFRGNEEVLHLTGRQLQGIQRFNRFVILVYIQSWYSCSLAIDAAPNDIALIHRLQGYDDVELSCVGLRMMVRHSWYISPELASLALFSNKVPNDIKAHLVAEIQHDRGTHLLTKLPDSLNGLSASLSFFKISRLDTSFLKIPVESWSSDRSYIEGQQYCKNLACLNDVAERGIQLIQQFNKTTKDEEQKQCLLQVVEQHRQNFGTTPTCSELNFI